jgi:type I restriction enzyme S subunit
MCKNASGQSNINAQELQNIAIPITPIDLQNKFANFVHQVERQKQILQDSLEKLERNYQSLIQKCFQGEIF